MPLGSLKNRMAKDTNYIVSNQDVLKNFLKNYNVIAAF